VIRSRSTSCFHSRSECSRANSRDSAIEAAHALDGDEERFVAGKARHRQHAI
jgi:hypothetical protein